MAFLDNWHPVQKAGHDTLCADLIIENGFTIRIEAKDSNGLEMAAIMDMLIFDNLGWNIHNSQVSKVQVSTLGLEFIEEYRDNLFYKNIPKHLVLKAIDILNGKPAETPVAVGIARQEKPCYHCKRKCDLGDKECWWCLSPDPTGKHL